LSIRRSNQEPAPVVVPIAGARRRRLAHVAHELRGALTAVELGLSKLERDAGSDGARTVSAVRAQLERAAFALDELDAARGESPSRASARFGAATSVEALLRERVEAWARVAPDGRGVCLCCATPLERVAARSLVPALDNLIANALEHGAGTVTVRAAQDSRHLTITVADEGPGMPAGLRVRRPKPGRGLGLDIARRATLACGGRLIAEPGHPPRLELPLGAPAA
jgi:two-component system, OmpR family, sensor kinase